MAVPAAFLDLISAGIPAGSGGGDPGRTEPTALAAIALGAHGRFDAMHRAARWMAGLQGRDGSVGVSATHDRPCWPTSLAVLCWLVARRVDEARGVRSAYESQIGKGLDWILSFAGETMPASQATNVVGHDTSIVGWPWVGGTHSWVEPTSFHLLTLKEAGLGGHPRSRAAVRLLVDRLLPGGGCNFGNTTVLGREVRPQPSTTGVALIALAGEDDESGRIAGSLAYLSRTLAKEMATFSLCYGLLGLAAHGRELPDAHSWLAGRLGPVSPKRPIDAALLGLAALAGDCPLIPDRSSAAAPRGERADGPRP